MSENIQSKEQFVTDIELTETELRAYQKILDGYKELNRLPENAPGKFRFEILKFENSVKGCEQFLERLRKKFDELYVYGESEE